MIRRSRFACLLPILIASSPFTLVELPRATETPSTAGGRFHGVFALSSPLELDEDVVLTMTLRLAHDADTAALDATVAILPAPAVDAGPRFDDPEAAEATLGSFDSVDLRAGASTLFSKTLVVPADQYVRWQSGDPLRISITFVDGVGERRREHVEIGLRGTLEEVLRLGA